MNQQSQRGETLALARSTAANVQERC